MRCASLLIDGRGIKHAFVTSVGMKSDVEE